MSIQSLTEFREDGREIPSTMSGIDMLKLGWGPSVIKRIAWMFDGIEYVYHSPYALSACIVDGGEFVALVESADRTLTSSLLRVISGNGRTQITVPNEQDIRGQRVCGQFEWFSQPSPAIPHVLGIVFRPTEGSDAYVLHVDAMTGRTIKAEYIRA